MTTLSKLTCEECGNAPAYPTTASGQPFSGAMSEGKMGEVLRFLCAEHAALLKDKAKQRLA